MDISQFGTMSLARKIVIVLTLLVALFRVYNYMSAGHKVQQRAKDLTQIKIALETFHKDNGVYPDSAGKFRSECSTSEGQFAASEVIPGLVPKYLQEFPHEPEMNISDGSMSLCYSYVSNGIDYAVIDANFANSNRSAYLQHPELLDPARDGGPNKEKIDGELYYSWKVYSPGGAKF